MTDEATSTRNETDRPDDPARDPDPGRWVAVTVMLVAVFMDLLDVSIINVAVPSIQVELGATYATVQWTTAGYTLAFAVLLITGGRLGDVVGRKRLFVVGVGLFVVASLACGAAAGPGLLVGGRIAQGVGAALMVPQVLAAIAVSFSAEERGKVVGLYGAVAGLALVSGPLLGGLLVSADLFGLGWRTVFLINVPVGLVCIAVAARYVRESRAPQRPRIDWLGLVLAVVGLVLLVFPLVQGRELGWPAWILALFGLAAVVLAVLVVQQVRMNRRGDSATVPLVALGPFRSRSYVVGLVAILLLQAVPAGFALVWTLHVQLGLGWTALHTGLTTIPTSLAAAVVGGLSMQVIVPRAGRAALLAGPVLLGVGVALSAWLAATSGTALSSWAVAGPFALMGIGLGLMIAPLTSLVLLYVAPRDAGSASGMVNTTQQLGGAIGIALIGVVFFGVLTGPGAARLDDGDLRADLTAAGLVGPAQEQLVTGTRECVVQRLGEQDPSAAVPACWDLDGPTATAPAVRAAVDRAIGDARADDFGASFRTASWWLVGALVVALGLMFLLPRDFGRPSPGVPDGSTTDTPEPSPSA